MQICAATLFSFLVLFARSYGSEQPDFKQWSSVYLPGATQEELDAVYPTWKKNADLAHSHNQRSGDHYQMTLNKFAYLTPDQLPKISPRLTSLLETRSHSESWSTKDGPLPVLFDWRKHGDVTPVHNQGQMDCGIVFPLSDAISSLHAIKTGNLVQFSYEQLHDCLWNNCSCDMPNNNPISDLGLCTVDEYPNVTSPDCKCQDTKCGFHIAGLKSVPRDEGSLARAVLINPVVATIDANQTNFQSYKSGVYSNSVCSSAILDHVVLIVGFGEIGGEKYWICKNSWGIDWGMQGYFLLARNRNNMCGIATQASYPYI